MTHVASLTNHMTVSRMSRHNVHSIHSVVPAPHHNTALPHHRGGEHLAGEPHRATNQGHKRGGVHWRLSVEGPQGVKPFGGVAVLRSGTAAVQLAVMAAKENERQ